MINTIGNDTLPQHLKTLPDGGDRRRSSLFSQGRRSKTQGFVRLALAFFLVPILFENFALADCSTIFSNQNASQDTSSSFQIKENQINRLSHPEDRVILRLLNMGAPLPKDDLLSPESRPLLQEAFTKKPEEPEGVKELNNAQMISELEALDFKVNSQNYLFVKGLFEARDAGMWEEVVRLYDQERPKSLSVHSVIELQVAMALNRLGSRFRPRAIDLVVGVIMRGDKGSEAYGILGRIYRDRYLEVKDPRSLEALDLLDKTIEAYLNGFMLDTTDFYPGVNALDGILLRKAHNCVSRIQELLPFVKKALELKAKNPDHWYWATRLNIALYEGDRRWVEKNLPQVIHTAEAKWMLETELEAVQRIAGGLKDTKLPGASWELAAEVYGRLHAEIKKESLNNYAKTPFPNTEGLIRNEVPQMKQWVEKSGIQDELISLGEDRPRVISIQKYLRETQNTQNPSEYIMGPTGPYKMSILALSDISGRVPWWLAFKKFGLETRPENSEKLMQKITEEEGSHIYMVIPSEFATAHRGSHSWEEYVWLMNDPKVRMKNVTFVFGAHDLLNMDFAEEVTKRRSYRESYHILRYVLNRYQSWLQHEITPDQEHILNGWRPDEESALAEDPLR